jgi:hypothetical protein
VVVGNWIKSWVIGNVDTLERCGKKEKDERQRGWMLCDSLRHDSKAKRVQSMI